MIIDVNEQDLKSAVLSLVILIVETVKEVLQLEATRRVEAGSLTDQEVERLGEALIELEEVIDKIKVEAGVSQSVKALRDSIDGAIGELVNSFQDVGSKYVDATAVNN